MGSCTETHYRVVLAFQALSYARIAASLLARGEVDAAGSLCRCMLLMHQHVFIPVCLPATTAVFSPAVYISCTSYGHAQSLCRTYLIDA